MDSESNIRLGDFGLATKHRKTGEIEESENQSFDAGLEYDTMEDISRLMGGSGTASSSHQSSAQESMTGGVGKIVCS